jgi:hypothetical protein
MSAAQYRELLAAEQATPSSKYGNRRVKVGTETLDSSAEARRYHQLLLLQRAGDIRDLQRQVRFQLAPACRLRGAAADSRPLVYVADFVYVDQWGATVIEDVKGHLTDVYKIKRHLMKTVLGHDIVEIKA